MKLIVPRINISKAYQRPWIVNEKKNEKTAIPVFSHHSPIEQLLSNPLREDKCLYAKSLTPNISIAALPGFHAITGCDWPIFRNGKTEMPESIYMLAIKAFSNLDKDDQPSAERLCHFGRLRMPPLSVNPMQEGIACAQMCLRL